jgi:hypothetical protein
MEVTTLNVKPLKWEYCQAISGRRYAEWKAYSLLGLFVIFETPDGPEWTLSGSDVGVVMAESVDQAKRDAQKVFDQRVLSALEVSRAPVDYAKIASEIDINWVAGLFGTEYGSGSQFLADMAARMISNTSPVINPLQWEHLGGYFYRAPAPLFGNIRIESFGAHSRFTVEYSIPGHSNTFVEGDFDTAELAMAAGEQEYQRRMKAAMGVSLVQPKKAASADEVSDEAIELARHVYCNLGQDPVRTIAMAIMAGRKF